MKRTTSFALIWVQSYFPMLALVIPLFLLAAYTDLFGGVLLERVVIILFINLMMVLALQTYMGNSGVASFGHVTFMLLGAYASILFTMTGPEKSFTIRDMPTSWWIHDFYLPFFPALILTGFTVSVIGGLVGIVLMRIGATASGLTSFALLIVVRIVALSSRELTGGTHTVVGVPGYTTLWWAVGWTLFSVVVAFLFKESGLGLRLRASREDERAAANFGINIVWVRWVAWVLSVFMTTIAGALWAHFVTTFSPHAFWIPTTFLILVMLIIGGRASVGGAVVGTIAITAISEGLRTIEYTINIQRVTNPIVGNIFTQQVVGFNEFVLAIVLLVILSRRPAGLMKGQEFTWPFRTRAKKDIIPQPEVEADHNHTSPADMKS